MRRFADIIAMHSDCSKPHTVYVHDGANALPDALRGSVLLLGNFDGLHLGHRYLVAEASRLARTMARPLAILQFDPHPRLHFRGVEPFLIASTSLQRRLLNEAGIDLIYAPRFDAEFASQSAETFTLDHLVGHLGVAAVVAGSDFKFGRARGGDLRLLETMGRTGYFSTHVVGEFCDPHAQGSRISSSRIRDAILTGRLDEAERLLGRAFETTIEPVADGWSFDPTQILPPDGIFTVEARGISGRHLGQGTLVLQRGLPEVRLPAGTSTLVWSESATGRERTNDGL
jgi:riboflavin kinase/FMN adenylyltransferase